MYLHQLEHFRAASNCLQSNLRLKKTLARSTRRNVLALRALLSAGNINPRPSPVLAAPRPAEDVDTGGTAIHRAGNLLEGDIFDLDAVGRGTCWATILIVLLNNEAVLCDPREFDVLEGNIGDGAGSLVDSLDADAVLGVDDLAVGDGDALDGVVAAAADGANRQAMAAGTVSVGEGDVLAGVNGNTVILVVDGCTVDGNVRRGADVKGIGVVAFAGAGGVVDGHVRNGQVVGLDTESLDRGVIDLQALNL